jgi:putative DNA primase/helicase
MQNFLSELSAQGYTIASPVLDGKIHRIPRNGSKDSAWYIGWTNHLVSNGLPYIVAEYGDWKTGEVSAYRPKNVKLTAIDNAVIKAKLSDSKKQSEADRKFRNEQASEKASEYLKSGLSEGSTPYMERKNISSLHGARIFEGTLQVPLRDEDGKTWGLQYITDDAKRFLTGSRTAGSFHLIGSDMSEIILCEGFATGASIRQAVEKTVAICFSASNMVAVAKILKRKFPSASFTVCGDDDRFTMVNGDPSNPGREAAEKAASMCHGTVVFPVFESDETKPTDFNDLHCLEGIDAVKKQLTSNENEVKTGFLPLGYEDNVFFFYHIPSKDIVRATTFSKVQLFQIAPMEYWAEKYPNSRNDADMNAAANDLIQSCKAIGQFDATRVRGTGVWMDEGRVVVNMGHCLIVDGKKMCLTCIRSWYIYIQTKNSMPELQNPLSKEETKPLIDACTGLKWVDEKSGFLLAGWIAIARIAGALPVRPHVWLTGGSGTGKSTVMDQIVAPALGGHKGKIYLQGSSTEAGIRQRMKCSSVPTIFDEFETTGEGSKERVGNLIELLRNTWSETQGSVVKGTVSGSSLEYNLQFAALVSSIRVSLDNDADRSRFSLLELAPHDNDLPHWKAMKEILKQIDSDFGERLFARSSSMVRTVRKSQGVISDALSGRVNQRFGQQMGMLLAGYWSLEHDEAITEAEAEALLSELDFYTEKKDAQITDEMECLSHLLSVKVSINVPSGMSYEKRDMSIGEAILSNEYDQVSAYGIKVDKDNLYIADSHAELKRIFRNTRWVSWKNSFRRLGNTENKKVFRFASILSRATAIPLSVLQGDLE